MIEVKETRKKQIKYLTESGFKIRYIFGPAHEAEGLVESSISQLRFLLSYRCFTVSVVTIDLVVLKVKLKIKIVQERTMDDGRRTLTHEDQLQ